MTLSAENRALATVWSREVHVIAQAMFDELTDQIEVVTADTELAALTLASCSSNVEAILSMLTSGIPASAAQAPVTALEHARAMAARGAEVNDTLRFYRLGQGHFLNRWAEALERSVSDPVRVLASLREATNFAVEYIDLVSASVSAEHLAERERRQRRSALLRADLIHSLLAGEPHDPHAAERTLGHRLDGPQLCAVCFSPRPTRSLEPVAQAVAEACGASRPLVLPDGPGALTVWLSPRDPTEEHADLVRQVLDTEPHSVSVGLGTVGRGLDGFRTSHDEAVRARRVAELTRAPTGLTAFDDVALLDLLLRDVESARRFVGRELGTLADPEPVHRRLRDTLRAVLAPRGGITQAARALGVHRNTVLQRVRAAEALLGHPSDRRAVELHTALLLADLLPALEDAVPRGTGRTHF
ncbi:MAG: helix-turn-helix domain-containing protein [Solirubrobacteraceae bacterium]|nr:helix-turn-helix domain-containing protein [Solirubrobacteraceae bacterium]